MVGDGGRRFVDAKLQKAREFLDMADVSLAGPYYNAAVSLAVSAAVNAADVILFIATGDGSHEDDHGAAARALRAAGYDRASSHLSRALSAKSKAQYSARLCGDLEATSAFKHADRLLDQARRMAAEKGCK